MTRKIANCPKVARMLILRVIPDEIVMIAHRPRLAEQEINIVSGGYARAVIDELRMFMDPTIHDDCISGANEGSKPASYVMRVNCRLDRPAFDHGTATASPPARVASAGNTESAA
jgi:hypothetical protein